MRFKTGRDREDELLVGDDSVRVSSLRTYSVLVLVILCGTLRIRMIFISLENEKAHESVDHLRTVILIVGLAVIA